MPVKQPKKLLILNILNLMDCGYNIEYGESIRMVPNPKTGVPEESYLGSDFYLERVYIIFPHQMAAKEGKYYLICNYDKYDDIFHYRLDRITELRILDGPAKPFEHLEWANGRALDLATYMKEHPYMYADDNVRAVFRVAKAMVSDVIDLFGTEVTFSDEDNADVTVTAYINEMAMEQFALNFAPDVTVLEAQRLREKIKSALEKALEKYN